MQAYSYYPDFRELDPNKKNEDWGNRIITQLRMKWRRLVPWERYDVNSGYLYGEQSNEATKAMFMDAQKTNIDFEPQKPMEKIRNILSAEIESEDIQIEVKATDPSSIQERDNDKELLSNRSDTEELLSHLGATINMPAYNMADENKLSGKDVFNGNIQKFDDMGLDESSTEDRNYFFETFYKLRHEAGLDNVIMNLFKFNETDKHLSSMVNDMMKVKSCALRAYVDEVNGAVSVEYLRPHEVFAIPGQRKDFKDAMAIGTERDVTVMQLIRRLGSSFQMKRDYNWLLSAINTRYGHSYSCIGYGENDILYGEWRDNKNCFLDMETLYNFKVGIGYIEFKTNDGKAYKVSNRQNNKLQPRVYPMRVNDVLSENSKFEKVSHYYESTYKSYYLIIGPTSQKLFKFCPLPYQYVEGTNDEISNFTICAYKDEGPSIVDVCRPHIKILEKAVKKYEYLINKAKESGYAINMSSLVALAEQLTTEDKKVDPMDLLKTMNDGPNMLYSTDVSMGGNGIPIQELKNGMTAAVAEFRQIYLNCLADINDQVGISPLRDAYAPQPREVAELQQQSLASSINATRYIDRSIMYVFSSIAVRMVSYVQDIVKFKDINSLSYDFLDKLVGEETLLDIKSMGDASPHRYGIFVEPFTRKIDRAEIKQWTNVAFQQGKITLDQMIMVNSIESPKRAYMALSYMQRKQDQQAMQLQQQKAQLDQQGAQAKHQMDMELLQTKIQGDIQAKNVEGEWYYKAQVGAAEARKEATEEKIAADKEKQVDKHNSTMEQIDAKSEQQQFTA
jgi:hypothetical protein